MCEFISILMKFPWKVDHIITHLIYLYPTGIVISLEQSEYLVANEDCSLSVVITMSNLASQDVIVEVTVSDGSASGKYTYVYVHKLHGLCKLTVLMQLGGITLYHLPYSTLLFLLDHSNHHLV